MPLLQVRHGRDAIVRVILCGQFAQAEPSAIVLYNFLDRSGRIVHGDLIPFRDDIEPVYSLVVVAHIVEALGRTLVVVKGNTGRNAVDEGGPMMLNRSLDYRHQLRLVAGEAAGNEAGPELQ